MGCLFSCVLVNGGWGYVKAFEQGECFGNQSSFADKNLQNNQEKIDSGSCVQVCHARIAVLNKITAKREIFVVNSDSEICVGNLTIKVLECWKILDPIKSDNLVFLEICEGKKNKKQSLIFRGWVSEVHPGYATLEHYEYALAVIECF